jgi:predicted AlkP superfamily pyrophosphatase or phosphodiesterase
MPAKDYDGQDDRPYESGKAIGRTFPHKLTDPSGKPGSDFYAAFTATPMANDLEVEFAKAAVAAENLGKRGVTDVLAVSFTANDVIGHAFGPESHEVQDAAVRVDRSIAELLAFLEKQLGGKQNLVVVFTADHGATPTPEYMASLGYPAGRIKKAAIEKAVNQALGERFGTGEWVVALEDPSVFLNERLVIERKLDFARVQETAGAAVMGIPGFAGYFTRTQLVGGTLPSMPVAHSYQLSFYAPRSGDVLLLTQPFYFWGKYGEKNEGSTHGSPYRYDSHVPLVFWGAGVKPGVHRGWVDISDVAPTLAALLDIGAPAGADGQARAEVLK